MQESKQPGVRRAATRRWSEQEERSRRTCLFDEVLVDPAAEVVPAIPPNTHTHFVTSENR